MSVPHDAKQSTESKEERRLDQEVVTCIRCLSMDAVQAANSGHPGTPMAMAPVAFTIWNKFMRFNPQNPIWVNRDRFVLSIGHASMLLYSLLYLSQTRSVNDKYESLGKPSVALEDIKRFRQLDSKCAGHPEYRWTSGVETTTGPLGQGVATSVGMALGGRWMAARYNKPDFEMINYDVYAMCGDGCMMEGVASEAASFAGHQKLSNLCWIYDNNKITIEGHTEWAFSEDVATRFISYGWNVTRVGDANDIDALVRAFNVFKKETSRPTLIIVDSHIAFGAPNKQDTEAAHGAPLGEQEIAATKKVYGWPENEKFRVPQECLDHFQNGMGKRGGQAEAAWKELYEKYKAKYPELAAELLQMQKRENPQGWDKDLPVFNPKDTPSMAGRDASGKVLNAIAKRHPWFLGGSADLAPSTKTRLTFEGAGDMMPNTPEGRNIHFGIREHAMGSILNGLALTKVRAYGSQFMIFSDYSRPTLRLSALMEIPVIYIYTHDSIGVGEDGPTHQPIEHLASMRAIPGLIVIRPGDANEVTETYRTVMGFKHEPCALVFSRQNNITLDRTKYAAASGVAKGAYVLAQKDASKKPDVILMASGSEVGLAVEAYEKLVQKGVNARVVSFPSWELFEHQSKEYQESVFPSDVQNRISIEESSTFGWAKYAKVNIGMTTFGASAPLQELTKKFGFTIEHVLEEAEKLLSNKN